MAQWPNPRTLTNPRMVNQGYNENDIGRRNCLGNTTEKDPSRKRRSEVSENCLIALAIPQGCITTRKWVWGKDEEGR